MQLDFQIWCSGYRWAGPPQWCCKAFLRKSSFDCCNEEGQKYEHYYSKQMKSRSHRYVIFLNWGSTTTHTWPRVSSFCGLACKGREKSEKRCGIKRLWRLICVCVLNDVVILSVLASLQWQHLLHICIHIVPKRPDLKLSVTFANAVSLEMRRQRFWVSNLPTNLESSGRPSENQCDNWSHRKEEEEMVSERNHRSGMEAG